jgi:hypothetical protein
VQWCSNDLKRFCYNGFLLYLLLRNRYRLCARELCICGMMSELLANTHTVGPASGSEPKKLAKVHAAKSRALEDANTVQHILDFAGPGHWAFYSTVSTLWLERCRLVPAHHMPARRSKVGMGRQFRSLDVTPQMTLRSAVFTSAATVRLAHAYGLRFDYDELQPLHEEDWIPLQHFTGSVTTAGALDAAINLGMPLTRELATGAFAANLAAAMWIQNKIKCKPRDLLMSDIAAADMGNVELLRWHKQQGWVF